jgi:hypothetical protein
MMHEFHDQLIWGFASRALLDAVVLGFGLGTGARCHRAGRDGEPRLSFQVRIKAVQKYKSCPTLSAPAPQRLFSVATRALPPVATDRE